MAEYTRIQIENAERLYNSLATDQQAQTSIEALLAQAVTIREIHAETGVMLNQARSWTKSSDELRTEAQAVAARSKRRAGVRGLVAKYGADSAERIIRNKTGRAVRVQR